VVPIFIDRGAPLSTHLRTLSLAVLASHDGSLEHVLAAFDPDLAVVDLDDIDKRPHVGLSKWHSPAGEMLLHHTSRCPLWADTVEKGFSDPTKRNHRIRTARYLNRNCVRGRDFESMLRIQGRKIVFQQYRPIADMVAVRS